MAAGSTIGTIFKVTTWGESHGKAIGVVVDGCPAGLPLDESDIQKLLDRRKPGQSRFTTQRKEGDEVEILSGVFEGKTTGTPISMIVRNTDQRSRDYSNIASCFRPGHADYTFEEKYGFRDLLVKIILCCLCCLRIRKTKAVILDLSEIHPLRGDFHRSDRLRVCGHGDIQLF